MSSKAEEDEMKINTCPKCGGGPNEILYRDGQMKSFDFEFVCYLCGLRTGKCPSEEQAVEKWNELTNNFSSCGE